tara:strand:+ start:73 stop:1170 length:1098 start_codon:yes stop_codon:yes gene_type:complete
MADPKIKIKRSSVAGKVPHYPNTLDVGEFAINTADGKVFIAAGVDGVGVGVTVREVGLSTETVLAQTLQVDGNTDLNGAIDVDGHTNLDNVSIVGIVTITGNLDVSGTVDGFRMPNSDGTEDQAIVTDGSGNLSFKTITGGGAATGAATTISAGITTATAGQTVFSTPHPHNDGSSNYSHQVFVNGVKMRPGGAGASTRDFVSSSNSTITFDSGVSLNSEVRSVVYYGHTFAEEYFTATQGQRIFALSGNLTAQKNFKVYVNGVKLRNGTDYAVSTSITLLTSPSLGDHIEILCDNAEDAFTATTGQTIFTPSSSEITSNNLQVFINGLILNETEDYTIGNPSVTIDDSAGLNAGDQVDVVIRRS